MHWLAIARFHGVSDLRQTAFDDFNHATLRDLGIDPRLVAYLYAVFGHRVTVCGLTIAGQSTESGLIGGTFWFSGHLCITGTTPFVRSFVQLRRFLAAIFHIRRIITAEELDVSR